MASPMDVVCQRNVRIVATLVTDHNTQKVVAKGHTLGEVMSKMDAIAIPMTAGNIIEIEAKAIPLTLPDLISRLSMIQEMVGEKENTDAVLCLKSLIDILHETKSVTSLDQGR